MVRLGVNRKGSEIGNHYVTYLLLLSDSSTPGSGALAQADAAAPTSIRVSREIGP